MYAKTIFFFFYPTENLFQVSSIDLSTNSFDNNINFAPNLLIFFFIHFRRFYEKIFFVWKIKFLRICWDCSLYAKKVAINLEWKKYCASSFCKRILQIPPATGSATSPPPPAPSSHQGRSVPTVWCCTRDSLICRRWTIDRLDIYLQWIDRLNNE